MSRWRPQKARQSIQRLKWSVQTTEGLSRSSWYLYVSSSVGLRINSSDWRVNEQRTTQAKKKTPWHNQNMHFHIFTCDFGWNRKLFSVHHTQTAPMKIVRGLSSRGGSLWNRASIFVLMKCTLIACSSDLLLWLADNQTLLSLVKGYRQSG